MSKKLRKIVSATSAIGLLFINDISASLTPVTHAEQQSYDTCISIDLGESNYDQTLLSCADQTPVTPVQCFPELTNSSIDINFYSSTYAQYANTVDTSSWDIYPYYNTTSITQNTSLLSTPLTTFTLNPNFNNYGPIPLEFELTNVNSGTNGIATIVDDSTINYTRNGNLNRNDIFTYTLTDVNGNVYTGKINTYPTVIVNDDATFENTEANGIVIDVGMNRSRIISREILGVTRSILTQPLNGSISIVDENLVYTPNTNFIGEDSFTFVANNGNVDSLPTNGIINVYDPQSTIMVAPYFSTDAGDISIETNSYFSPGDDLNQQYLYSLNSINRRTGSLNFTTPEVETGSLQIPINISSKFRFSTDPYTTTSIIQVDNVPPTPIISVPQVNGTTVNFNVEDEQNSIGNIVVEASKDNFQTFDTINTTSNTSINNNFEVALNMLEPGNYIVRVRVQQSDEVCSGFSSARVLPPVLSQSVPFVVQPITSNPNIPISITPTPKDNHGLIRTGGVDK